MTQKETAQLLDGAAERCESVNLPPATGKQCWFLAKLLIDNEVAVPDEFHLGGKPLTKKAASELTDSLLKGEFTNKADNDSNPAAPSSEEIADDDMPF